MAWDLFRGDPPLVNRTYHWNDMQTAADVAELIDTQIVAGGTALALQTGANSVAGGIARSITGAADTNGRNVQLGATASNGQGIFCQVGKPIRYVSRVRPTLGNLGSQTWGLSIYNDQSITAGVTDFIGLRKASGTTRLTGVLRGNNVEVTFDTGIDLANATFVEYTIDVDKLVEATGAGEVRFTINEAKAGSLTATATAIIPTATTPMVPAWEHIANGGSGALNLDIDYFGWETLR